MNTCASCPNQCETKFCSTACKSKFYRNKSIGTLPVPEPQSIAVPIPAIPQSTDTRDTEIAALRAQVAALQDRLTKQALFIKQRAKWLAENIPVASVGTFVLADIEERVVRSLDKWIDEHMNEKLRAMEQTVFERLADSRTTEY